MTSQPTSTLCVSKQKRDGGEFQIFPLPKAESSSEVNTPWSRLLCVCARVLFYFMRPYIRGSGAWKSQRGSCPNRFGSSPPFTLATVQQAKSESVEECTPLVVDWWRTCHNDNSFPMGKWRVFIISGASLLVKLRRNGFVQLGAWGAAVKKKSRNETF